MLERDGLHRTYGQSSPIKPRSKFSDIFLRFLRLTNGGARCLHFLYLLPPFFSLKASTRHPNLSPQPITSSPRKSFESAESTGRFNFSLWRFWLKLSVIFAELKTSTAVVISSLESKTLGLLICENVIVWIIFFSRELDGLVVLLYKK